MGVENFLDANMEYITYEDSLKLLEDPESFPTRVIPHEYGWWINVSLDHDFEERMILMLDYGYSQSFVNLMRLANKHKCWWINLDCDGGEYVDGLEFNGW